MSTFMDKENKRKKQSLVSSVVEKNNSKAKGRPCVTDRELKKRVTLSVTPSVYENVGKIAYIERISISELTMRLYSEYIADNLDKIEEFQRIKDW